MSVKIRPFKGQEGVWEVDIIVQMPNGQRLRERKRAPVSSKSAALRWGQERERHLIRHGDERPSTKAAVQADATARKEVPTLAEFVPRLLKEYYEAERRAPGTVTVVEGRLRLHLVPHIGHRRLDEIGADDVTLIKSALRGKAVGTVNGVLTVLSVLLHKAVEWGVTPKRDIDIPLLVDPDDDDVEFYDRDAIAKLLDVAKSVSPEAHLCILLGADTGMRRGEIVALQWKYVDFERNQITVALKDYRGQLGPTKGKRKRRIHMTRRLHEALLEARHQRGPFVLMHEDGRRWTGDAIEWRIRQVQWRAGFRSAPTLRQERGKAHKLRHTCGSLLAMKGAPALAIKEILGHRDISTTEKYMHLAPRALESAIKLLEDD